MEIPNDSRIGSEVPRREDGALLTGRAEFTDDLTASGTVHLAFVRSQYGHARIEKIDATAAVSRDSVLAVFTWDDIETAGTPGILPIATEHLDCDVPGHPVLARNRIRYQGQPIAAVVAEDQYRAYDAADAVEVAYERLDAVTDPLDATANDAPTLFDGAPDNVAAVGKMGGRAATEQAFADADTTVELDLVNNRLVPNAMEPRAALARYDTADERLTVEMTSQSPHGHRSDLAHTLGLSERTIRVIAPSVGGGFGHKGHHYPGEAMAAWCAMELDRPVKWTATRSGNYLAGAHGRDHRTYAALAFDTDGIVRGLEVETHAAVGGYGLGAGPALAAWYGRLLSGQYRIPAIHCRSHAVFTNTAPVHSYRGAGRPEAIYVTERLMDTAARGLGLDPAMVRRRNQIAPDGFPYETPVGAVYDSGDYETALNVALDAVGYDDRPELGTPGEDGRYRGVGLSCYVESTGSGFESGVVRVHPDGGVTVYAGTHSHGQGHETTYAQIVADELGVPYNEVAVVEGDTERVPTGTGTFGSRSTVTGGNAVAESAREVATTAQRIAADRLETTAEDVTLDDGAFHVAGAPDRAIPFADVAAAAYGRELPEEVEPGLEATTFYEPDGTAYSFGTHAAVVAVDPSTGAVEVERYVAVDDCGERVNPRIVEGQIHGGVAQGIGQALYEAAEYDENANLVTGSMQDYTVPKAEHIPTIATDSTVTPSPHNPLGVKGIGEAGTIAAPPAVVNAVVDALAPLGVRHIDMPLTDETVWRAIHE